MKTIGKLLITALLLGGAGAGVYFWHGDSHPKVARAQGADLAVPAVTTKVEKQSFSVYLSAIGTVQAYNMVTVRARVDGQLDKVAFTEGQDVKAGDVLAIIDPRPFQTALEQAEATKAKDTATLANAELDLKRYVDLRDFASRQSLDTQRATVAQLHATLQGDQAAIDNAKVQLGYTTIVAPLSGRTGARLVDQGNMVRSSEGAALLVITQIHPIFVTFTLPQDALDDLKAAQRRGTVEVEALKRDGITKLATGSLSLIDNQIDAATGTIRLKATFTNEDDRLWPGQFVNVKVLTEIRPDAIAIPAQVVQRGPQGTFAFVVNADQTVATRALKTGPTDSGTTVVESGLAPGEIVVVEGQYKLRPGTKVQPQAMSVGKEKTARNP